MMMLNNNAPRFPRLGSAASVFLWLARTARTLVWKNQSSYLALTPPFFKKQYILNRSTLRAKQFAIRDELDYETLTAIFVQGQYKLERLERFSDIQSRYEAQLRTDVTPLIVDCGANICLSAEYFSEKFPESKIVALEPSTENIARAKLNCHANNVTFIEAAVGPDCAKGRLIDPGLGNRTLRVTAAEDGDLEIITIKNLIERHRATNAQPFLIKIDIEGFEEELFSINTDWVDEFPVLVIEVHDWLFPREAKCRSFLQVVSALDRDFVHIGESIFSISNRDR
jgi:FkbM family methyltransferase